MDTVICPVDCVSHDACQRVKRFCKQHYKQFLALNGTGITSFSRALDRVTEWVPGQVAENRPPTGIG